MTARFNTALIAFVAFVAAAAPRARAQTQPPPFGEQAPLAAPPAPARPAPRAEAQSPAAAPAQPPSDDDIDDPKVFRRLGTRITVPPAPAPSPPPPAPQPAPVRPPPAPAVVEPIAPPPPPGPTSEADTSTPTLAHVYHPTEEGTFRPSPPRLKLALRHFNFVRIGASDSSDGLAAPETFNSIGVDVYPLSSVVRIGLTTAFGWQSGTFLVDGDYFATQSFSLGGQYRDLGRVVPFAEAFTGVGYMRRLQFDRTVPTAFWQFGADAGVEVYVARMGYLSFAFGYLRPVNGFAKRQQFTTVFVDTWSLKVGIGI